MRPPENVKKSYIEYAGQQSSDYGLLLVGTHKFATPEMDLELTSIPGKSRDLIRSNDRFKNVLEEFTFKAFIRNSADLAIWKRDLSLWLRSRSDYSPLWFSDDPYYYRNAICYDTGEFERIMHDYGNLTVSFSEDPFKYRTDGIDPIVVEKGQDIVNYEAFEAFPDIHIVGNGDITLTLGTGSYQLKGVKDEVYLSSEYRRAYGPNKATLETYKVVFNHQWPTLAPNGYSTISWTGDVQRVEVTPKWRTLL